MKWFCFHDYKVFKSEMYSVHVWSIESFPSNDVYRYEYSFCQVVCNKCNKTMANYKIIDIDHPVDHKNSHRTIYVDINNVLPPTF